jgi:small subunit ribosomal protein S4
LQLREKQKVRRSYGVLEGQFSAYFEVASRQKKVPTGLRLLQLLESRLDNIIHRSGLVPSRAQARQLIRHGHFTVNGKVVSISSFQVIPGQVISVAEKSAKHIKELVENNPAAGKPTWLDVNLETLKVSLINAPSREDLDPNIKEALIVEYYSR